MRLVEIDGARRGEPAMAPPTTGAERTGIGLRHLLVDRRTCAADAGHRPCSTPPSGIEQALAGREVRKLPTLRGRTVVTLFYEDSTRTRVSFELAGKWMSADVINFSANGLVGVARASR